MQRGDTKYTALDGTPALKEAIRTKFQRENDVSFDVSEITVATGAKQILFNAMMATIDAGDEVIIPTPYWTSYSDIVQICQGKPVLVPCDAQSGFRLTAEKLEAAITPRTRWLLLNSPSNPSGAAYSAADYRPLLDVLLRHPHVWLMVDDMYEHIVYDDFRFVTPLQLEPRLRERTLTINGVSKAYAMTGWRIGYAGGPKALIKAMAVVQSQATSCPSSISQAAAVAALSGPQDLLAERTESFRRRRDLVVSGLNAIDGLDCRTPEGAFYTFSGCGGILGLTTASGRRITTDSEFCAYLLEEANVAVVPGSAFGLSPSSGSPTPRRRQISKRRWSVSRLLANGSVEPRRARRVLPASRTVCLSLTEVRPSPELKCKNARIVSGRFLLLKFWPADQPAIFSP